MGQLFAQHGIPLPVAFTHASFKFNPMLPQSRGVFLQDGQALLWRDVLYTVECQLQDMFSVWAAGDRDAWYASFGLDRTALQAAAVKLPCPRTVDEVLRNTRTNRFTGVYVDKTASGSLVLSLRCGGQCGLATAMKGIKGTWPQPQADAIMREHFLMHHPEWCHRVLFLGNAPDVRARVPQTLVDVDTETDEFAVLACMKKANTVYAGVVRTVTKTGFLFQARCQYCSVSRDKKGQINIPGAYGYRLDVEAAIAFGKHVKEHHLDRFEALQVKHKKQKTQTE